MALKLSDIIKIANEFNFNINETSLEIYTTSAPNDQPSTNYALSYNNDILLIKKYMMSEFDKNEIKESIIIIITFMNDDICRTKEFECIDDVYNFVKE